jgi:serine/threonine-protein kinase
MEPTNRTPAGDQYSLGCVLYHCVTGRVPFPEGSAVEKMMAHQTKDPTPIKELAPDCPDGLAAVIARLMAKTPEGRYAGTDEVAEALEPFAGEFALPKTGSAIRQGLAAKSGFRSPGLATPAKPPAGLGDQNTPPPAVRMTPPAPAARPAAKVPGRSSMQMPVGGDEVPLTPAGPAAMFAADPAALRASAGWLNEADPPAEPARKSQFGTPAILAAAGVLMVLVFFGAKLLMKQ